MNLKNNFYVFNLLSIDLVLFESETTGIPDHCVLFSSHNLCINNVICPTRKLNHTINNR